MKDHYKNIMKIISKHDDDHGADRTEAVEQYVRNFPELKLVNCSDRYWTSSIVVFVPFVESDKFRGMTMISIPQCGQRPVVMHFYQTELSSRIDQMIGALKELKNELPEMQKQQD